MAHRELSWINDSLVGSGVKAYLGALLDDVHSAASSNAVARRIASTAPSVVDDLCLGDFLILPDIQAIGLAERPLDYVAYVAKTLSEPVNSLGPVSASAATALNNWARSVVYEFNSFMSKVDVCTGGRSWEWTPVEERFRAWERAVNDTAQYGFSFPGDVVKWLKPGPRWVPIFDDGSRFPHVTEFLGICDLMIYMDDGALYLSEGDIAGFIGAASYWRDSVRDLIAINSDNITKLRTFYNFKFTTPKY